MTATEIKTSKPGTFVGYVLNAGDLGSAEASIKVIRDNGDGSFVGWVMGTSFDSLAERDGELGQALETLYPAYTETRFEWAKVVR